MHNELSQTSATEPPPAASETAYDKIPYTATSFPQLNPAQLGAIGKIFGLEPADPGNCRLLELGCGHGLTPIALGQVFPDSHFTGIDLSSKQIENGRQIAEAAGLTNVRLEAMSITDPRVRDLGTFDYIVCHGVYSWVPPEVQQAILQISSRQLAEGGMALVSYNTYPGWKAMQVARDIAIDMAGRQEEPAQKVRLAAQFIQLVAKFCENKPNRVDAAIMQRMAKRFGSGPASYLLHEYMEEHNAPCYFREFMQRAEAEGLHYVGETALSRCFPRAMLGKAFAGLSKLARDRVDLQQLADYLLNTQFRHTILAKQSVQTDPQRLMDVLPTLEMQAMVKPPADVSLAHGVPQEFKFGQVASSHQNAYVKAFLVELSLRLTPAHWDELWSATQARIKEEEVRFPSDFDHDAAKHQVLRHALQFALRSWLNVYLPASRQVKAASRLPSKPEATPLSRSQAAAKSLVSNLNLTTTPIQPIGAQLLTLADGTRTIEELVDTAIAKVVGGEWEAPVTGQEKQILNTESQLRPFFHKLLDVLLSRRFFQQPESSSS